MEKIKPTKALYIKLGRGGEFEKKCLAPPGTVYAGWNNIDHELCMSGKWKAVRKRCLDYYQSNETAATNRTKQLRLFYESGEDVLWITFHNDYLYWCFADKEIVLQADKSKIRMTKGGWRREDIEGVPLDVNRLSGSLLTTRAFRGVICQVKEFEYLVRKINCESSPSELNAINTREALIKSLVDVIQSLNWKEFELLTDLIFRQAGWQRLGVLGKTTKDIDLDLLSPIDNERYKVQVKSTAGNKEFQHFLSLATDEMGFARYYFVVHKPDEVLIKEVDNPTVKVWLSEDIARLVVNYGLVDWLIAKAK